MKNSNVYKLYSGERILFSHPVIDAVESAKKSAEKQGFKDLTIQQESAQQEMSKILKALIN